MKIEDCPKMELDKWIELSKSGEKIPVITTLNGDSMAPLIRKSCDIVTIIPTPDELKVGQIAVFRISGDTCIAHRIVNIDGDKITTFGDNCRKEDVPIHRLQIVGILSEVRRGKLKINLNCKAQNFYGKIWNSILRKLWFLYVDTRKKLRQH